MILKTARHGSGADLAASARLLTPAVLVIALIFEWITFLSRSFATGMGQDFTTMYVAALTWLRGVNPYASSVPGHLAAVLHVRYQGDLEQPLLLALFAPLTVLRPHAAYLVFVMVQTLLVACGGFALARICGFRRP